MPSLSLLARLFSPVSGLVHSLPYAFRHTSIRMMSWTTLFLFLFFFHNFFRYFCYSLYKNRYFFSISKQFNDIIFVWHAGTATVTAILPARYAWLPNTYAWTKKHSFFNDKQNNVKKILTDHFWLLIATKQDSTKRLSERLIDSPPPCTSWGGAFSIFWGKVLHVWEIFCNFAAEIKI